MSSNPLRVGIVGCGGMGRGHASGMAALPEYQLVAACDLNIALAQQIADKHPGTRLYTDYALMLKEQKPDVVVVATNNVTHAPLTIQAVEAGARGVYCEKPMASSYGDAKAMVEACRQRGAKLAVNHQRRCLPVFRTMRRLIEEGAIGKVELIVGSNAGDVLSDGTHFVDTVRHLAGDADVKWVLGQIYRKPANDAEPKGQGFQVSGGFRYGHVIETGGFAVMEFANGIRAEVHSGEMIMNGRWYQHYEVLGTKGRLLRANDNANPPLVIQDEQGGWRPVPIDQPQDTKDIHRDTMSWIFRRFAEMIHTGCDHPLCGDSALKDQEVVMAVYESARLRQRLNLPLQQDRFPLELMVEQGQF